MTANAASDMCIDSGNNERQKGGHSQFWTAWAVQTADWQVPRGGPVHVSSFPTSDRRKENSWRREEGCRNSRLKEEHRKWKK